MKTTELRHLHNTLTSMDKYYYEYDVFARTDNMNLDTLCFVDMHGSPVSGVFEDNHTGHAHVLYNGRWLESMFGSLHTDDCDEIVYYNEGGDE